MALGREIKQNPFSKKLRTFDNKELKYEPTMGVYLTSNELAIESTFQKISKISKVQGGYHVGFSGPHNFDIIAERQSSYALICDINPDNAIFMQKILDLLCTGISRLEFIKQIKAFIKLHYNLFLKSISSQSTSSFIKFMPNVSSKYIDNDSLPNEIEMNALESSSWYYSDDRFNYIKKLACEDKIALITTDICDYPRFLKIAEFLEQNMFSIDSLYISNIQDEIQRLNNPAAQENFLKTIQSLAKGETIIINSNNKDKDLHQQVQVAKEIIDWNKCFFDQEQIRVSSIKNSFAFFDHSAETKAHNPVQEENICKKISSKFKCIIL